MVIVIVIVIVVIIVVIVIVHRMCSLCVHLNHHYCYIDMNLSMSLELKDRLSSTVSKDTSGPRVPRWYFGGIASAGAACITHPLDTMKVYYQTSGLLAGRQTLVAATIQVIKKNGFLALYNGLTASILRQLTYSTVRFGIYEATKQKLITHEQQILPLYERMIIAAFSGAIGGLVGTPPDVVNVRMQNDIKLEERFKRNYRNAIQGLKEIYRKEGPSALFRGSSMVMARSILVSIGQLAMYDQFKYWLVSKASMAGDKIQTHVISSTFASITCTILTQPLDVLKTRIMNQSETCTGQMIKKQVIDLYRNSGVRGFYKGFVPALIRVGPHTVLVFVIYEQLRIQFGMNLR